MRNIYRVATMILLLSGRGYGQQTSQSDREAIQQLLQQVRELQQRVQALETERTTKASSPPSKSGDQADSGQRVTSYAGFPRLP